MKRTCIAAVLVASLTSFGASDALARPVAVTGHVLAPSSAAGSRVSVPVLLTRAAERRLRAGTPVVRLLVRRRARVSAPAAVGTGQVSILPSAVRAGDRFSARVAVRKAALRRARLRRVPSFAASGLRVTARASGLSNDELTRLVLALQSQLAELSRRVDELSNRQSSDVASLRADLNVVSARIGTLETSLGELQSALSALDAELRSRIAQLEGDLGSLATRLTAVETQVDGLLSQVATLEQTTASLQSDLSSLGSQLASFAGDLGDLQSDLDDITTRLESSRARSRTCRRSCRPSDRWTPDSRP